MRNLPALAAYLLIDLIEAALIAFVLALVTTLAHNAYQAIPSLPFGLVFAVTALILVLLTLAGVQHGPYSRNSGNGPTV